jgi:hypothetical protein
MIEKSNAGLAAIALKLFSTASTDHRLRNANQRQRQPPLSEALGSLSNKFGARRN